MLEVEFAQISDVGRVRAGNEDYIGYLCPETPGAGADAGLAICAGRWRGWARSRARWLPRLPIESLARGFPCSQAREKPCHRLMQSLVQTANARVFDAGVAAGIAWRRAWPPQWWLARCVTIARWLPTSAIRAAT